MKKLYCLNLIFAMLAMSGVAAQKNQLRKNISELISTKKATVGIAVGGLGFNDTMSINNVHLPMQSVFKFHLALYIMHQIDRGKLSLSQRIYLRKSDMLTNTWSPLQKEYPNGNVSLPLNKILSYTVSQSDNNGCDILLRLIGGTQVVDDYIHRIGIKDVAIHVNEEDMHADGQAQFRNWTTPVATVDLLKLFYNGKILSKKSFQYLWKIMTETSSGKDRLKGQLPAGTVVAHKTGTSGANKAGVFDATNDVGIVTLPNGKHYAISVFVANSREKDEANAKIISDISRMVWDYFIANGK